MNATLPDYLPIVMVLVLAIGFGVLLLVLAAVVGPKRPTRRKLEPFECGNEPLGPTRVQFSIKFFIVALLFVIFDIEVVFFFLWAPLFRQLGILGLVEMFLFVFILVCGLVYAWRKGVLDWG